MDPQSKEVPPLRRSTLQNQIGNYLKTSVNTVPRLSLRVKTREPLCILMIWRDRLSPMPVPSCFVVKNGTKISSWLSLLIG